jgi:IS6 family transposase
MASFSARHHLVKCAVVLPLCLELLSYRDLEEMMRERGIEVDHSTINRWVLSYAPELDQRVRPHLKLTNDSWRVDETYLEVKGA